MPIAFAVPEAELEPRAMSLALYAREPEPSAMAPSPPNARALSPMAMVLFPKAALL